MLTNFKHRFKRMYRRHAVFRITRAEELPRVEPRIPVTFQPAAPENLADIRAFRADEIVNIFERYLQKGQLGVFAYRDWKAVAHGWVIINRGQTPIRANGYFRLQPREALVHFCSVADEYRGQGIYQALLCELYRRAFASEPVDAIYIDTEINNVVSRKAIAKTASFVTRAYYLRIFSTMVEFSWPWKNP